MAKIVVKAWPRSWSLRSEGLTGLKTDQGDFFSDVTDAEFARTGTEEEDEEKRIMRRW